MARKFLTPIDLGKLELQNAAVQNLASAPSSPVKGQIYFDSVANHLYAFNGSTWEQAGGGTAGVNSVTAGDSTITVDNTDPANPTVKVAAGGLTHSYISDFDTQVHASRLDQLAAPTADLSINSHKLTSVTDPTSAQDAATKAYVDSVAVGIDWKPSVKAASTANLTLSGTQTVDGVALSAGDRILVKDQTSGANNGIYVVASGAWSRATDADASSEVTSGLAVFVEQGTTNADTGWLLTTTGAITLGTTSLAFTQFTGLGEVTPGTGLSKVGNTINLATPVSVANGGTNATTAAAARTSLGATGKYSALIGDGSATSIAVTQATHGLASNGQMLAQLFDASTGAQVDTDITINNSNGTVTFIFAAAPASNAYRAVLVG